MNQRIGYILCGGCLFSGVLSAQSPPPNIVVFLADDQGWGDLSFNGNRLVSTPNIDRIAREGASFENFYVCPVSAPTRAEFLTGRYPFRCGVTGVSEGQERLDTEARTIADYLKEAGYNTGVFGKWHNGTQYPYHPNARGFDEFYGFCSGHWGNYWEPMLEHNGVIVKGEGFLTNDLTNRAIAYMEEHKGSPFFVYLPFNTPHSPMQVTDEWWDKWKNKSINQLATEREKENSDFTRAALALTENIDWNVGRIMKKIEELGIDENTIVLYFTDNGPNSNRWNGRMRGIKGTTDEGGVRSPLFIRWPVCIKPGKIVSQLSGSVDLMPTLLSLIGCVIDLSVIDGINIAPCLLGDKEEAKRTLYRYWGNRTSLRQDGYVLSNDDNLYNVRTDRLQSVPLNKQYPSVYQEMKAVKDLFDAESRLVALKKDDRPFLLGHLDELYSKLPARDGHSKGGILRSNKFPNSSYFTNWTEVDDEIYWDVDVYASGEFEAIVYYSCSEENIGSIVSLDCGTSKIRTRLNKSNASPLIGAELDRVPRQESYMKNFQPFSLGTIRLEKGKRTIRLQAESIAHKNVMDMYMLAFKRIK